MIEPLKQKKLYTYPELDMAEKMNELIDVVNRYERWFYRLGYEYKVEIKEPSAKTDSTQQDQSPQE